VDKEPVKGKLLGRIEMRLSVGSDMDMHVAHVVFDKLREQGHEVVVYGPLAGQEILWPEVARRVAEDVAAARADEGVLFCWTGTGVSLAANKVPGIRAALCDDAETARGARLWNNANVLCMSLRRTSEVVAEEILQKWFETEYRPNREDDTCLAQVEAIERDYLKLPRLNRSPDSRA
jgi:ribose 5-phosphate isomerase B